MPESDRSLLCEADFSGRRWPGYLISLVILVASAVDVVLHIWPDAVQPSFGFDGWRTLTQSEISDQARPFYLVLVLVLFVISMGWYRLSQHMRKSRPGTTAQRTSSPLVPPIILLVIWLTAVVVLWTFRTPIAMGDGEYIAQRMSDGRYFSYRWYLGYLIILTVHRTLGAVLLMPPLESLQLTAVLAGATVVVLLGQVIQRLFRERDKQWLFIGLLPSAYGAIQLWFGYSEIYPVVALGWVILVWAYLLILDERLSPLWGSALSGIIYLFYIGNVLLLPAYVFTILLSVRRMPNRGARVRQVILNLLVLVSTTMLCLSWKLGTNAIRFWQLQAASANITQGTSSGSVFYSTATLLSGLHVKEFINEWALVDASGVLLTMLGPLFWALSAAQGWSLRRDTKAYLLALVAFPSVIYSFMMEPLLGYPMDWDLFSYLGLFTLLFGGYMFIQGRKQLPAFGLSYSVLAASGWLHLLLTLPPLLAYTR